MKLPIATTIQSRDGSSDKDSIAVNALVEEGASVLRPALVKYAQATGNAGGCFVYDNKLVSINDTNIYTVAPPTGSLSSVSLPSSVVWTSMARSSSVFCAVSSGTSTAAATSSNGSSWTARTLPVAQNWWSIAWNGSVFCATGNSASAATSSNGTTWTTRTLPSAADWYVAAAGKLLCAMAAGTGATKIATSNDNGATWTSQTAPSSMDDSPGVALCSDGSQFLCLTAGYAYLSADGATWEQYQIPFYSPSRVVWNGVVFIATAYTDGGLRVIRSYDGKSWHVGVLPDAFVSASASSCLVAGNKWTLIGDHSNVGAISEDGLNWTQITLPASANWNCGAATSDNRFALASWTTAGAYGDITPTVTDVGNVVAGFYDFTASASGDVVFLKSTTKAYTWNGTVLTTVSDVDYPATTTRGTAYLSGRVFVMTPDGLVYQSALENFTSYAALEYIGSDAEPSAGVYLCRHLNYICAMKEYGIVFFYDAANASGSILSPAPNTELKLGCASAGSVQSMAGTLVFMSQTREGLSRSVYFMNGMTPEKISIPGVERIINSDSLASVTSWSAKIGEHVLYGLNLESTGVSLVYDFANKQWSKASYLAASPATPPEVTAVSTSGIVTAAAHGFRDGQIVNLSGTNSTFDGFHVIGTVTTDTFSVGVSGTAFSGSGEATLYEETTFPAVSSISCNGKQLLQAKTGGVIYELSQTSVVDEIGAIAYRARLPKFDADSKLYKTLDEVEVVGDKTDAVCCVRWSDDDYVTNSNVRHVDLLSSKSRTRRCGKFYRRSFEVIYVGNRHIKLEALDLTLS